MRFKNMGSHSLRVTLVVKPRIIGSSPVGVDAFTVNRGGYNIGCYVEELLTEITPMAIDIALIISVYALLVRA